MATTGRIGWTGATSAALGVNAVILALLSLDDRRPRGQRPTPGRPVLYVELEPAPSLVKLRPRMGGSAPEGGDVPPPPRQPTSASPAPVPHTSPLEVAPTPPDLDPRWRVAPEPRIAAALPLSCDAPHRLSLEDRRRCDLRWAGRGETARALTGTGNAERDARFARQGARRLAAWEARRAEPSQGDPPCETPHPVAGCTGVNIQVELFSSRDGLLPNLRKRRE